MAALSDYLENKLIDFILRGQTFTPPATVYVGLLTATPSDAGGGTEVSGNNYSRVGVASSLANWAGTQGAGTTVASSGATGTTSNNNAISFPTPSGSWGTVVAVGIYDASSAGNLLMWGALSSSQIISTGNSVSYAAGQLQIQIDN